MGDVEVREIKRETFGGDTETPRSYSGRAGGVGEEGERPERRKKM